jgi:hypothetical protein
LVFSQFLVGILLCGKSQVTDHRIYVVLELGDFAPCLDLDRPRQITLGHCRGNLGDGADLGRQVRGQKVYVAGEIFPDTPRTGTLAWPPSRPSTPTSRATEVTWSAKVARGVGHVC